jgi:uncharacterized protein YciI
MFIVSITYTAPLEAIDAALPEHVAFLDRHYAAGVFIASGRKVPRTGGVILAATSGKDALSAILAEDPFSRKDLATYRIEEFIPSKSSPEIQRFFDSEN